MTGRHVGGLLGTRFESPTLVGLFIAAGIWLLFKAASGEPKP